jgi:hypothetical protein
VLAITPKRYLDWVGIIMFKTGHRHQIFPQLITLLFFALRFRVRLGCYFSLQRPMVQPILPAATITTLSLMVTPYVPPSSKGLGLRERPPV